MEDRKRYILLAIVCALVLLASLLLPVPSLAQTTFTPASKINFGFTGCKNTGVTSLSQLGEAFAGQPCTSSLYTSGNLQKGWAVLDLVPFHVDLAPQNGATTQDYDFVLAFDYAQAIPGGPFGFDQMGYTDALGTKHLFSCGTTCAVSIPVPTTTAGVCTATVTSGYPDATSSVTGGIGFTGWVRVHVHQDANDCGIDYWGRLAPDSSLFNGSSLQAYIFSDPNTFSTGKSTIPLPIPPKPVVPTKTETSVVNSDHIWTLGGTVTPASISFPNTCSPSGLTVPLSVTVNWAKDAGTGQGAQATTQVTIVNPSLQPVDFVITDNLYAGTTTASQLGSLETGYGTGDNVTGGGCTVVSVPTAANPNQKAIQILGHDSCTETFAYTPTNSPSLGSFSGAGTNDVATVTAWDPETFQVVAFPSFSATASSTAVAHGSNGTANVSNFEGISGTGFSFDVASINQVNSTGGAFVSGYTLGSFIPPWTFPLEWNSGSLSSASSDSDSGSITFNKSIKVAQYTQGTGSLTEYATILGSDGLSNVWPGGTASVPVPFTANLSAAAQVSLTVSGALNAGTGSVSLPFTIDGPNGCAGPNTYHNSGSLTISSTTPVSSPAFGNLDPGTYCVTPGTPSPAGYAVTPSTPVEVALGGTSAATCANSASFTVSGSGHIIVKKVTNPSSDTSTSFSYTTTGDGYGGFSLVGGAQSDSGALVAPGSYSVSETALSGWTLTGLSCSAVNSTGGAGTSTSTISGAKATISLVPGDTVTCTYTNTGLGHIIVTKHTSPATPPDAVNVSFPFTTDGAGFTGFSLLSGGSQTDGGTPPAGGLAPGVTYKITEGQVLNWALASVTCSITTPGSGASTWATSITGATSVTLGAGDTVTCDYHNDWPDGNVTITPSNPVNQVGNAETFTITVNQITDGATAATSANITYSFPGSTPGTVGPSTCGASVPFSGNTASCTLTINSASVGTFQVHAKAVFTIGGITLTRETGDSAVTAGPADGPDAVKHYVDANITIGPANATNEVNHSHTFNIVVTALPDAGPPPSSVTFGTVTATVTPTPGTLTVGAVTCQAPVGNVENCSFTINSSAGGTFTANACTTVTIGGLPVAVCTNDSHAGDVGPAVKNYIDATTTLTLVSQVPSGTVESGTSVTITVNEANTGNSDLTSVSVTGSPCAAWVGPTSLAAGKNANYTCTFNAAVGTNNWSANGNGIDSLGNPELTANEQQSGSFSGVLSTLIVVKNTVGGNGNFSFSGSGVGVQSSFSINTSNNTGSATFAGILSGPKSIAETVPAGWLGNTTNVSCTETVPGVTSSSIGTLTTGTVAAGSTITANVSLGIGATVTCTFTNALLPTLNVVKNSTGLGGPFNFTVTGPSPETDNLSVSSGNSAQTGVHSISIGDYTFAEDQGTMPPGFSLTDLSCSTGTGSQPNNNGIPTLWSFTANYGDAIVCEATNSNVGTTRTQGFWATHTALANNVWNGAAGLPNETSLGADAFLCTTNPITAVGQYPPNPGANELMGGFWSNISQLSNKGGKRKPLDQARMQMLQQYLAAVLNVHAFGTAPPEPLSAARAAYCGTDINAIKAQVGILGTFNQSGDALPFTPGASATAQASKDEANIPFWDNTYE